MAHVDRGHRYPAPSAPPVGRPGRPVRLAGHLPPGRGSPPGYFPPAWEGPPPPAAGPAARAPAPGRRVTAPSGSAAPRPTGPFPRAPPPPPTPPPGLGAGG